MLGPYIRVNAYNLSPVRMVVQYTTHSHHSSHTPALYSSSIVTTNMTTRSKHSLMSFMTGKDSADKYSSRDPTLPVHEPSSAPSSEAPPQHNIVRREFAAFLGEFIGTFMFLFLAFTGTQIALNAAGTQQLGGSENPAPDVSKLIYIAFAFGVSLAINVAIFSDISGAKFNPAVCTTNLRHSS